MASNLQIAQSVPLINPQDESYRSVGRMMGQQGTGLGKDILKIGKKVAKDTKILSTAGRALQPLAVGVASSINPELGMAVQYASNKGIREAQKRGFGIASDVMKAAKKVGKSTQVSSKLASALAPTVQALADSTGNPLLSAGIKEGMKQAQKQMKQKGYGKRKSKK